MAAMLGMLQPGQGIGLALEHSQRCVVDEGAATDDLQRNAALRMLCCWAS